MVTGHVKLVPDASEQGGVKIIVHALLGQLFLYLNVHLRLFDEVVHHYVHKPAFLRLLREIHFQLLLFFCADTLILGLSEDINFALLGYVVAAGLAARAQVLGVPDIHFTFLRI